MFDVVVVGGGPAGLSAAMMLGRCRRRVLVLDLGQPRNRRSHALHGYLSRDGIAPAELIELGRAELHTYGIELRALGAIGATQDGDSYRIALSDGSEVQARYLLIATGVVDDLPAISGFDECYGRSIFHCPYCDGWEWRDRPLAAFGAGADAAGLALGLKTWSADVVVCTNGARLPRAIRERLERNEVRVYTDRLASVEHSDGALRRLVFASGDTLNRDALFFATGQHPQSSLAISLGCILTKKGTVKTGTLCDTNVTRVFVAGDASRDAQFVVVAAAEGVKAAVAINKALQREELKIVSLKAVVEHPQPPAETPPAPADTIRMPTDIRSAALTILALLASVLMLQYAQAMIIPLVLGILINYALEPVVAWLVRRHIPRPLAAAVVLFALVGGSGWALYGLRPQASAIVEQLPAAARRLRQMMENDRPTAATAIQQVQKAATELEKAANAAAPAPAQAPSGVQRVQVEPAPINITDYVMWGSLGIVAAIGQLVMIVFLAYFLLASGDLYRRKLVKLAGPTLSEKKLTVQILQEIDRQIERFLVVQVFTSTIVAVATWLAFRALGLEQAAVWGLLAGVFNSIPYFGPVLVTGGTSIVAFLQFGNLRMAVIIGAVSLVITSLEGFLLTPWLTSRAARMNAVAIFVGLLFWGWVWNVWGMLLAVPLLMVIKAVCDHVEDFKGVGELLGD